MGNIIVVCFLLTHSVYLLTFGEALNSSFSFCPRASQQSADE